MIDVNKAFKILANVNQRRIFLSTSYENWGIPFGLPPPCERDESKPPLIYQVCDAWVSISKEKVFSNIKLLKNEIFFNKTN
jgi:hypothetical protein